MNERIGHEGIVERISGDTVFVRILQQSACAGCHAKNLCAAANSKSKIIEVTDRPGEYHPGEEVMIYGQESNGLFAVLLAFVIPLVVVIAAIFILMRIGWSETSAGLTGLLLLVPYYGVLALFRKKLKRKFVFTLEKIK